MPHRGRVVIVVATIAIAAVAVTVADGLSLDPGRDRVIDHPGPARGPALPDTGPNPPRPVADAHPRRLGRFRLRAPIGPTAMGPAFDASGGLAAPAAAVHVLRPDRAADAPLVARLFRRVVASGLVDSDHVAPWVDIGVDRGAAFVARSSAPGRSLADLLRDEGPIPADRAGSIGLQVARALAAAHDQGLAHGGLIPGSVVVSPSGLARIVDLGEAPSAAEQPPPPAKDARADAPAPSGTAPPPPPPEPIGADRDALADLILGAIAGSADPRSIELAAIVRRWRDPGGDAAPASSMAGLVARLESFLEPGRIPRSAALGSFREVAADYDRPPMARSGALIGVAVVLGPIVLGLFAALLRLRGLGAGLIALGLMTWLAVGLAGGLARGSAIGRRLGALATTWSGGEVAAAGAAVALVAAAAWAFGVVGPLASLATAATLIAVGLEYEVARPLAAARRPAVEAADRLVAGLRLAGYSEDALRDLATEAGWARRPGLLPRAFDDRRVAPRAHAREASGPFDPRRPADWIDRASRLARRVEDRACRSLDGRLRRRHLDRAAPTLAEAEERGGEALGSNLLTARRRARRVVAAVLAEARRGVAASDVLRAAADPESVLVELDEPTGPSLASRLASIVVGPLPRFAVGAAMTAGFLLWVHQNRLVTAADLDRVASIVRSGDATEARKAAADRAVEARAAIDRSAALRHESLPPAVLALFRGVRPGIAGLLLLVSCPWRGWRPTLLAALLASAAFAIPPAWSGGL